MKIYPPRFTQDTLETLPALRSPRCFWIYWLILGGTGSVLVALPLISLDVGVLADVMIRPASERVALVTPLAGTIEEFFVSENQAVEAGQAIAKLRSPVLEEQIVFNRQRQEEVGHHCEDLSELLRVISTETKHVKLRASDVDLVSQSITLQHEVWQEALRGYRTGRREFDARCEEAIREAARAKALAVDGLISVSEKEQAASKEEYARASLAQFIRQTASAWETQYLDNRLSRSALMTEGRQLAQRQKQMVICSPVAGFVLGMSGLSPGQHLLAGQTVGEVSPSQELIATAWFAPSDIGFLERGQGARIAIDGFPATEWGWLSGTLLDLSADFMLIDQRPMFRARIKLERSRLERSDGLCVTVKKGMSGRVRLLTTRRSLWQLLYQDASEWLSPRPTISSQETALRGRSNEQSGLRLGPRERSKDT